MNFIVLEKEHFEKICNDMSTIMEAVQIKKEEDLSSSFIESKRIPKLLGISLKTWQTYRDKGQIPFIQLGSKIWVKRSDIEAFMDSHYIRKSA
jgi:excisionase family DNA binding protein